MKMTIKQLKQIIKEELQHLYETEQVDETTREIRELFLIGATEYEMMQTLIEDLFGKSEGVDYALKKGRGMPFVTIYSDDEQFLDLIDNSLGPGPSGPNEIHEWPVTYGVNKVTSDDPSCKTPWAHRLEIFKMVEFAGRVISDPEISDFASTSQEDFLTAYELYGSF